MIETFLTLAVFLLAVLVLIGLVKVLGLGTESRILTLREAAALAEYDGRDPVAVALAADGSGALVRDTAGHWLMVRRHGVHFITRALESGVVQPDGEALVAALPDDHVLRCGPLRLLTDEGGHEPLSKCGAGRQRESWV